jgi:hypothetical protein
MLECSSESVTGAMSTNHVVPIIVVNHGVCSGIHRSLTLAVVYTAVVFDVFGLFGGPVSRGHIVFLLTLVSFLGDLMYYVRTLDAPPCFWGLTSLRLAHRPQNVTCSRLCGVSYCMW